MEGVANVFKAQAARDHFGIDIVAGRGVRGKHLPGDLCVSWLVGADQAELIATEDWDKAVEQKKDSDYEKDDKFANGGDGWRLQELLEPHYGCAAIPCAGDGGMLDIVHFPKRSETRLSESCPQLGEDALESGREGAIEGASAGVAMAAAAEAFGDAGHVGVAFATDAQAKLVCVGDLAEKYC